MRILGSRRSATRRVVFRRTERDADSPPRLLSGDVMPGPVLEVMRRRDRPVVVQTLRSALAATVAFLAAVWLTDNPRPLLAPLTALLVVQVTLYATLTAGVRRVVSVVAGVLLALAFAALVGFSWWSLGLLILLCLIAGHLLRVEQFVPEVAITGMLVLGVGSATTMGMDRVLETMIGAAIGLVVNVVIAPPMFVQSANAAIDDLARKLSRLLAKVGAELREGESSKKTGSWLQEARDLDQEIIRVEAELSRAEESLRLNPRALRSLHTGIVLRSGLETLEHCAVATRGLCRALVDLSRERGRHPSLYGQEITSASQDLLSHLAQAAASFGRLLTAEISEGADRAEADLDRMLIMAREHREHIDDLLLAETDRDPETWELHGAVLAHMDRLLNELDLQKRAEQLAGYETNGGKIHQATRQIVKRAWVNSRGPRNRHRNRGRRRNRKAHSRR